MNSLCVVRPIQFIFTIINSLKGILVSHHIFICDPIQSLRLRSIRFAIFVVSTTGQGAGTIMNHVGEPDVVWCRRSTAEHAAPLARNATSHAAEHVPWRGQGERISRSDHGSYRLLDVAKYAWMIMKYHEWYCVWHHISYVTGSGWNHAESPFALVDIGIYWLMKKKGTRSDKRKKNEKVSPSQAAWEIVLCSLRPWWPALPRVQLCSSLVEIELELPGCPTHPCAAFQGIILMQKMQKHRHILFYILYLRIYIYIYIHVWYIYIYIHNYIHTCICIV